MEGVDYPSTLQWNVKRERLTGAYLWQECVRRERQERSEDLSSTGKQQGIFDRLKINEQTGGSVPRDKQELALLEDLLFALRGVEGTHVKARPVRGKEQLVEFYCDSHFDNSLKELVRRILPLCGDHYRVHQFVEARLQYPHGLVSHALGAALRTILLEYEASVTQMDDGLRMGQLSLAGMWFQCQPLQRTFRVLAALVKEAEAKRLTGAALLNLLSQEAIRQGGDQVHQAMLQRLWRESCVPYTRMLEGWVYEGIIDDPYAEFFIVESLHIPKEADALYWEQRYRIRQMAVPEFLQPVAEEVLTTGKCLNAIRECGRSVEVPFPEGARLTSAADERMVLDRIREAYQFACKELLTLIMKEYKLVARLESVKHCFLLDQGDFMRDFMDTAKGELCKWKGAVSREKLVPLLELALRTSACSSDPFHEDITCTLEMEPLVLEVARINRMDSSDPAQLSSRGTEAPEVRTTSSDAGLASSAQPHEEGEGGEEENRHGGAEGDRKTEDGGREREGASEGEGKGNEGEGGKGEGEEKAEDGQERTKQVARDSGRPAGSAAEGEPPDTLGMAEMDTVNGWETFTLDYKVQWPVSLVVSRRAIGAYQIICRHLFHSLHTQRELCATWQIHQASRPLPTAASSLRRSHFLGQRMLHFVENMLHFTTREVLEPNWHIMKAKLGSARSIDEVIGHHEAFLHRCLQQCQLLDLAFVQRLSQLKATCLEYATAAQWLMSRLASASSNEASPAAMRRRSDGRVDSRVVERERQHRRERRERVVAEAQQAAADAQFSAKLGGLEASFAADLAALIEALARKSLTEPSVENLVRRLQAVGQGLVGGEPRVARPSPQRSGFP